MSLTPGTRIGVYQIAAQIGVGGMGEVYQATDTNLKRQVAIKYLQQAGIKPSVVRLADIGIHGNSHVMMLEKNNKDVAAVVAQWLDKALPQGK